MIESKYSHAQHVIRKLCLGRGRPKGTVPSYVKAVFKENGAPISRGVTVGSDVNERAH